MHSGETFNFFLWFILARWYPSGIPSVSLSPLSPALARAVPKPHQTSFLPASKNIMLNSYFSLVCGELPNLSNARIFFGRCNLSGPCETYSIHTFYTQLVLCQVCPTTIRKPEMLQPPEHMRASMPL